MKTGSTSPVPLGTPFSHMISCWLSVSSEPKVIGFAMYYFTYDPWTGKLLYLEDFFVVEEFRGKAGPIITFTLAIITFTLA